jgi:hypothetical protein
MLAHIVSLILASAILQGPASPLPEMGPRDAIFAAADAAPVAISGLFVMRVRAGGRDRGRAFLNSELDYRDQRNLTIRIERQALARFEADLGMPPERFFLGKSIRVRGMARRERIDFIERGGRRTDLYYYQTQVEVSRPEQIEVVSPGS